MNQTFEAGSTPDLQEKLTTLVGVSGYRVPTEGRAANHRPYPEANRIIELLMEGSLGRGDMGPHLAYDIATESMGAQKERICQYIAKVMRSERMAAVMKNKGWVKWAAIAAYRWATIKSPMPPAPEGVSDKHWFELTAFGVLIAQHTAADTMGRAIRVARTKAERRAREVA